MPLYLTIRAGQDPATAPALLATTDVEVIRAAMCAIQARVATETGHVGVRPLYPVLPEGSDAER